MNPELRKALIWLTPVVLLPPVFVVLFIRIGVPIWIIAAYTVTAYVGFVMTVAMYYYVAKWRQRRSRSN